VRALAHPLIRRHLAEIWATTYLPPHPKRRLLSASAPTTPLSTIEHLVLIDLLGASHPLVRSYFPDTAWLFDALVSVETRLRDAGILDPDKLGASFFRSRTATDTSMGYMGDDHVPFLHRGVSVLHVITEPFPHVWHTLGVSILYIYIPPLSLLGVFSFSFSFLLGFVTDGVGYRTVGRRDCTRSPDPARVEPHPSRVLCRVSRATPRIVEARTILIPCSSPCPGEEIGL